MVAANHGVGGYSTSSRNAWALLNGNCAGNMILIAEGSGNYLWGAPELFETPAPQAARVLSMAVAGRMQKSRAQSMTWKAREPLVKWLLLALAMGNEKNPQTTRKVLCRPRAR